MADKNEEVASTSGSIRRTVLSNAKFEVEKFDGTNNFGMWQCEVLDLLFREGSHIALEPKPKDISEEDWNLVNRQACSTIRLCLAKEQKYFVMKETLATSLWKKLEDKYMTKSIENRLYLKKKLFRFEYKTGTPMIKHLDNFNKIIADLQNLDVEIQDEDLALLLLNSLPETYEHLTTTLLYGKDEVKFSDVSNALVNNEYRKKDQQDHVDTTLEALSVSRGRSNYRAPGKTGRRSDSRPQSKGESFRRRPAIDECAYCHQKGHWKKDCPNKDKSNANLARDDDVEDVFSLSASTPENLSDRWILDSGCSYHMCPNRQWFSRLEEIDGGVVLMGNDNTCRIRGIGSVHLKMHDGTTRRLTEVRYVPDLKKNLISLGALDARGYKVIIEGGVMKVVRGSFLVMKGTQERNLYYLNAHTVTGKAFRLWNPKSRKVVLSRDVTFDESEILKRKENQNFNSPQQVEFEIPPTPEKSTQNVDSHEDDSDDQGNSFIEMEESIESIATSRPKRNIRKPVRYTDMVAYALPITEDGIPSNFREAMHSPEKNLWKKAMEGEMKSLHQNQTWKSVPLPKGKKAVGCKGVYVKKKGSSPRWRLLKNGSLPEDGSGSFPEVFTHST